MDQIKQFLQPRQKTQDGTFPANYLGRNIHLRRILIHSSQYLFVFGEENDHSRICKLFVDGFYVTEGESDATPYKFILTLVCQFCVVAKQRTTKIIFTDTLFQFHCSFYLGNIAKSLEVQIYYHKPSYIVYNL